MDNDQSPIPTEQPAETPVAPPVQPEPKSKKRLALIISAIVFVLLIGFGAAYTLLGNESTDKQTQQNNEAQTTQQDQQPAQQDLQASFSGHWLYTNEQERRVYIYNAADNKSTPILELAEGEHVSASPDGKTLVRTRKNVIETAASSDKPEFKQVYADTDQSVNVRATWLPDSSGFIVNAAKLTNPQDDNGGYWVPRYVYTVSRIKIDGSEPKKLFEYPVAWGTLFIDGVDLQRDELYISEDGEGGLRVALGIYRLSDGAKLKHYEDYWQYGGIQVANGKAYYNSTDSNSETQIIEINLDSGEEKVLYNIAEIERRSFMSGGKEFFESIRVLNMKISKDQETLYFDEVYGQEKSITKLKAINLKNGNVKEVYTLTTTDFFYITVRIQIATPKGVIALVNCGGGCSTEEYNSFGNEWIFIDPTNGKWQIIQKTTGDMYDAHLSTFSDILIPQ